MNEQLNKLINTKIYDFNKNDFSFEFYQNINYTFKLISDKIFNFLYIINNNYKLNYNNLLYIPSDSYKYNNYGIQVTYYRIQKCFNMTYNNNVLLLNSSFFMINNIFEKSKYYDKINFNFNIKNKNFYYMYAYIYEIIDNNFYINKLNIYNLIIFYIFAYYKHSTNFEYSNFKSFDFKFLKENEKDLISENFSSYNCKKLKDLLIKSSNSVEFILEGCLNLFFESYYQLIMEKFNDDLFYNKANLLKKFFDSNEKEFRDKIFNIFQKGIDDIRNLMFINSLEKSLKEYDNLLNNKNIYLVNLMKLNE